MEVTIMKTSIQQTLRNLITKTNEVKFITMARKMFNVLAALFTVALVMQFVESNGKGSITVIATMALLATLYAASNKCQTHLLKLKIEELLPSVPTFGSPMDLDE